MTLGAFAGGQQGLSSSQGPGRGLWLLGHGGVRARPWARWLEPAARARHLFAPDAASMAAGALVCAAAHPGATRARCASTTRRPARPGALARRRRATDRGPSDRLWRPGRHDRRRPSRSDPGNSRAVTPLRELPDVSTKGCAFTPWPTITPNTRATKERYLGWRPARRSASSGWPASQRS